MFSSSFFRDKSILVTGGTGLIGRPLVDLLVSTGAKVRVASLDAPLQMPENVELITTDLRELGNCLKATEEIDIVFVNSRPVDISNAGGINCMGCDLKIEFFLLDPILKKNQH